MKIQHPAVRLKTLENLVQNYGKTRESQLWLVLSVLAVSHHLIVMWITQATVSTLMAAVVWGGALICIEDRLPIPAPGPSRSSLVMGSLLVSFAVWRAAMVSHFDSVTFLLPWILGMGLALLISPVRDLGKWKDPLSVLSLMGLTLLLLRYAPEDLLSEATGFLSAKLLWVVGFDAFAQDREVILPGGSVRVAGPCSGMEQVAELVTIAIVFLIAFRLSSWPLRLAILAVAPVLAVIGNALRIAALAVIHASTWANKHELFRFFHDDQGALVFAGLTVGLFGWIYMLVLAFDLSRKRSRQLACETVSMRPEPVLRVQSSGSGATLFAAVGASCLAQRVVLVSLALVSAAAIAFAAHGTQVPLPEPVRWERLVWPGLDLDATVLRPAAARRHLSHGDVIHIRAAPAGSVRPLLTLTLVPVRTRSHEQLRLQEFAESMPEFAMTIEASSASNHVASQDPVLAFGTTGGRASAQACITSSGVASGDIEVLLAALSGQHPSGWRERARQLIGVGWSHRWECVLVSISVEPDTNARDTLAERWRQLMFIWNRSMAWRPPTNP